MRKLEYHHTAGDSRMLYGMGGPLLVAVALIIGLLLIGDMWVIPLLMLSVFALTGLVLWGIGHMLDEQEGEHDL
jgi:hypothetical protein